MYQDLLKLEEQGKPIRVALIGAGLMGKGIAYQIHKTPGMRLKYVIDRNMHKVVYAQHFDYNYTIMNDTFRPEFFENIDVLVEATGTVEFAVNICEQALKRKKHVILMNAEVDSLFGPLLNTIAKENGVICTSDAGDQHGVLARMIEEIKMWGFEIMMAGNMKGFLNRYAQKEELVKEAKKRNLNLIECVSLTDGTKLNIEMSLLCNGFGLEPYIPGMEGPKAKSVNDVFKKFDFNRYVCGVVDYLRGATPGSGVFVIGKSKSNVQHEYMEYYKVINRLELNGYFYYLFYRPYHLCHVETPRAIAKAFLYNKAVLQPKGMFTEVYAYAKKDLPNGTIIERGIGGDDFYGLIDMKMKSEKRVPILLLDGEGKRPIIDKSMKKDEPLLHYIIGDLSYSQLTTTYIIQGAFGK